MFRGRLMLWMSCGRGGTRGFVALVEPAYRWLPERVTTLGDEAADLAESAGMALTPEQRLALQDMYGVKRGGKWAALEVALICSRQNLKTYVFRAAAIADLFLFDARLVIWTAHLYDTAQEAFRDITATIEGSDDLRRRVKRISNSHGDEGIELLSGQRLNFLARSKTGGRGLSGDVVFLDEGFALDATVMGALFPTLSAISNPQVRVGSSAGHLTSQILRGYRRRGRGGGDPSLAYDEWCAPEGGCASEECDHMPSREGCALDDRENWFKSNPSMLSRGLPTEDFVAGERRTLPPAEFARERMGWWEDPVGGDSGIDPVKWAACADEASQIIGAPHLSVDVSPLKWTAIAISGVRADGLTHVEVPVFRSGTDWVPESIRGLCERNSITEVTLDPSGPAGALKRGLEAAGVTVVDLSAREMAQAQGTFVNLVDATQLRHLDDEYLNMTVRDAATKPSGDAKVWSRRNSAMGGAPLIAATIAVYQSAMAPTEVNIW